MGVLVHGRDRSRKLAKPPLSGLTGMLYLFDHVMRLADEFRPRFLFLGLGFKECAADIGFN